MSNVPWHAEVVAFSKEVTALVADEYEVYIYMCVGAWVGLYMYSCLYVFVHEVTALVADEYEVYMYVGGWVYGWVCIYVYVSMYLCMDVHVYIYCMCTSIATNACVDLCMCISIANNTCVYLLHVYIYCKQIYCNGVWCTWKRVCVCACKRETERDDGEKESDG